MNYRKPLQRQSTMRWDYTNTNDNRTWPIGYCRGWVEPSQETVYGLDEDQQSALFKRDQEVKERFREKYHSNGHATAEEACECQKQYNLDQRLHFGTSRSSQHKCEVCSAWTQGFAEVDGHRWTLCEAHCNREEVEKLYSVGESFGSY